MVLKVEQTESKLENKFEIKLGGNVEYFAGSPWIDLKAPVDAENVRKSVLTDKENSVIFSTNYNIVENVLNSAIPLKWVFTGNQKNNIYRIYDKNENEVGKFYELINGIADTKFVVDYNNTHFICYDKSVGKTRHLMIYQDETQIAEIVKPLAVIDNKDCYYLYLLDEYQDFKDILLFFVIFFDYNQYANRGKVAVKSSSMRWSYTIDANEKFYDKNWIENHFPQVEVEKVKKEISSLYTVAGKNIKKTAKFTLTFFGIGVLLCAILAVILFTVL